MGTHTGRIDEIFEPWYPSTKPLFPTTNDVLNNCTPAMMARVSKNLQESSPIHLLPPHGNQPPVADPPEPSALAKLQALRDKWRDYTHAIAALPLASPDGQPLLKSSLAQARLQWEISDKEGPEMSAETFHFLHTHELLEFPKEQE